MKFLNLGTDKRSPINLITKPILLFFFWVSGFCLFVFRIDALIVSYSNIKIPGLFLLIQGTYLFLFFFILLKGQKWYNKLLNIFLFIFYPVFLIFWYLPKWLLFNAKVYIFIYYIYFVLSVLRNYKKVVLLTVAGSILIVIMLFTNSPIPNILLICVFTYVYYKFFRFFISGLFAQSYLGEADSDLGSKTFISSDSEILVLMQKIESNKEYENLNFEEKELKIKEKLLNDFNMLRYIKQRLSSLYNTKSYILFGLFQMFLYFFITFLFITFINYKSYQIDNNQFAYSAHPSLIDFVFYTFKSMGINSSNTLLPNTIWTKSIEVMSYFLIQIMLFIVVIVLIFSFQRDMLKESFVGLINKMEIHNVLLSKHITNKYGEVQNTESDFIKWFKGLVDRIL